MSEFKVPKGWKLVPLRDTNEMMLAAYAAADERGERVSSAMIGVIYRAMLAAAPAAPAVQEPVAYCDERTLQTLRSGTAFSVGVEPASRRTDGNDIALYAALPAHPAASVLVEALEQFADDSNWCYDTCDISRDVAKRSLAAYRAALAGKGDEQPTELNPDDLEVDVRGIAVRDGVDMRCGSAVRIKHIPTGISVERSAERSQHANKEAALAVLTRLVAALAGKGGE